MPPEGFRLTEHPQTSPRDDLLRMAWGYRTTQALYVVAKLGVADVLERGPATADAIAAEVGAHPRSLFRVMRTLAALGVFTQDASDRFGLTPLGDPLRTRSPESVRHMILMVGDQQYRVAGELLHTVRTGETAYDHVHGMGHFAHMAQDPEEAATFNAAMAEGTRRFGDPFASLDLTGRRLAVDVGGGRGELLAILLRNRPDLRGVLYDLPQGVAEARPFLESQGVADRVRIEPGSMFDSVPPGGDVYLLSRVLHDWPDDRAALVLRNCRAAIADDGVLLIREGVVPPGDAPSPSKQTDLVMLFMLGGAERTEAEWRALLERSGFAVDRIHRVPGPFDIIAAKPI
jgi:SAM-dependent methyltransferase